MKIVAKDVMTKVTVSIDVRSAKGAQVPKKTLDHECTDLANQIIVLLSKRFSLADNQIKVVDNDG